MVLRHRFTAHIRWTGAERGPTTDYAAYSRAYVVDIDGKPRLEGSADKAFRGDAARHNPEDMLIAALSACHMLTYLAEAARSGIQVLAYEDEAEATMVLEGGGGRFTEAVLHPKVTVAAGTDLEAAEALHGAANRLCFIANSVNFPVRHDAETLVASAE
ncbi:MAG: peroxiredoxin [Rhodospirillaceae bacterium]|nr:peroxiredoxin [Rhodospirillaceae bacterium]|tara:strand:- start:298 stop:774 length:477 start_codon:yes stop_codon:yes gene_type:complete